MRVFIFGAVALLLGAQVLAVRKNVQADDLAADSTTNDDLAEVSTADVSTVTDAALTDDSANHEEGDKPALHGGWSKEKALDEEASKVWEQVLANSKSHGEHDLESFGKPVKVSRQVVAGHNYRFLFGNGATVQVHHQPWKGEPPKVTNVVLADDSTANDEGGEPPADQAPAEQKGLKKTKGGEAWNIEFEPATAEKPVLSSQQKGRKSGFKKTKGGEAWNIEFEPATAEKPVLSSTGKKGDAKESGAWSSNLLVAFMLCVAALSR